MDDPITAQVVLKRNLPLGSENKDGHWKILFTGLFINLTRGLNLPDLAKVLSVLSCQSASFRLFTASILNHWFRACVCVCDCVSQLAQGHWPDTLAVFICATMQHVIEAFGLFQAAATLGLLETNSSSSRTQEALRKSCKAVISSDVTAAACDDEGDDMSVKEDRKQGSDSPSSSS